MNITIPDNTTIPLGRNAVYGTLDIDVTQFAPHVLDYVFSYGLRQVINDAMAVKKDDDGNALPDDQIRAKAEKRLANMYAGELRQRGEAADPVDPVEAEAYKLARATFVASFKSVKGEGKGDARLLSIINAQRGDVGKPALETLAEAIERFLVTKPDVRKDAARNVRERQKNAGSAADLGLI